MSEKCELDTGRECHNSTRLALLEKRVEDLENGQSREEKFRKDYYQDREERNLREQRLEGKITEMDGKLDKVVEYQEAQQSKPNKLLDKLKDRAAEYIMIALLGLLLLRLGISA